MARVSSRLMAVGQCGERTRTQGLLVGLMRKECRVGCSELKATSWKVLELGLELSSGA